MSNHTPFTYSVTSLNQTIAATLSHQPLLQWFYCVGEISNLIKHRSGHWYFSLKDEQSVIKAVMFKQANFRITTPINNGDQVLVYGSIDYYGPNGNLQIIVSNMKLMGEGALLAKLEKLKQHYSSLGYFDQSHKKALPKYPFDIGLIVGANSAAQADAYTVLQQRWPIANVHELNPLVQGEHAASQISKAIKQLDGKVDVIVVVRGGGSIEDLWAFNESIVVETVYNCNTPIVSGVGHESDTTLIDYVADYRANTPTGAMVAATANYSEVQQQLEHYLQQLHNYGQKKIHNYQQLLNAYASSLSLDKIQQLIATKKHQLHQYQLFFDKHYDTILHHQENVDKLKAQLIQSIELQFNQKQALFQSYVAQLNALSPLNTLSKGYSMTFKDNKVVKCCADLTINDTIVTQLVDGYVESTITAIEKKDKYGKK